MTKTEYKEYLQTEHWAETRDEAFGRACDACQVCRRTEGLNVHHNTYANLWSEQPQDLVVLCRECHKLFHDNRAVKRVSRQRQLVPHGKFRVKKYYGCNNEAIKHTERWNAFKSTWELVQTEPWDKTLATSYS